ncbi:PREDICTED: antileukoproteinase, partial [Galeopterus variegatus]|uniref:Antileukoproteinase n=1 Tax=Galeopterus variegatus TaxID=482537 RepID=A0ABM0SK99_GALVR
MKSSGFFPFVVLLALGTLIPWDVEGSGNGELELLWSNLGSRVIAVALLSSVKKPGKCPVVRGQCMMLNPPNFCEMDGECKGNFKCCRGMCGKVCVSPVK